VDGTPAATGPSAAGRHEGDVPHSWQVNRLPLPGVLWEGADQLMPYLVINGRAPAAFPFAHVAPRPAGRLISPARWLGTAPNGQDDESPSGIGGETWGVA
jgi:hypothetical protein